VSAVEGVQAQTRVLMRALQRLRVPTLFFVNKLDRRGADLARVRADIAAKLTPAVVSPDASAAEVLADPDDDFLAAYLEGGGDWRAELAAQTARAVVHPLFAGSAITGAGVPELVAGIRELLPARVPDVAAPVSGTVFKVERGEAGEKVAYVRLRSGTVRVRERLGDEKVTAIRVFGSERRDALHAGEIGRVWGLDGVRIGDPVGEAAPVDEQIFAPVFETLARHRVRDCTVTMTHSGYWARQSSAHGIFDKSMSSTAGDFRGLTPVVLLEALCRAGTTVYEPLHRFALEFPAETLAPVLPVLGRLGAVPETPVLRDDGFLLEGTIPAQNVYALQQLLPGLTRGEGVMESAFERYEVMARSSTR
jgi:translation elongation factor EF-G